MRSKKSTRHKELSDILRFVDFTNKFKAVERLIWYKGVDRRECDGEHTFQLAILAWFVNERCKCGLNTQRLIEYALVHDLVETYANDTPAFVNNGNGAETPCRQEKLEREKVSEERICEEWGNTFPSLVKRMRVYTAQEDDESRFIYALDKLLAEMNIARDGGRTNHKLEVTLETLDLYKRPRISRHPFVLELYDELFKTLMVNKEKLFFRAKAKEPVS